MKKVVVLGIGAITAGAAFSQEVQSTKKSAIMTPVENLYGRVEVRQTSMRWNNADGKKDSGVTSYRLVPRLGTKAFNNRLDAYVETPIVMEARTSSYAQKASYYLVTFTAFDNNILSITPYSEGYLPYNGADFASDVVLNVDVKTAFETAVGKFTVHGGLEPRLSTGTEPATTDALVVDSKGSLSLNADGTPKKAKRNQSEPTSTLQYFAGVGYTPSFAPKFSVAVDGYFDRVYTPAYEARQNEEGERLEKTGYQIEDKTLTDVVVSYAADKQTTIQSLTRIRHDGLYAESKRYSATRAPHVEQRISLIQKLF